LELPCAHRLCLYVFSDASTAAKSATTKKLRA
jgi:hypothetical protein